MSEWHPCVIKLSKIESVPNSDFLEITTVMEEYPSILRKGEFKEGDLVAFFPFDTVCPDTEQFNFLCGGKYPVGSVPPGRRTIKSKKIRGTYSEGLLIKAPPGFKEGDSVVDYFGITKRVYDEELEDLPLDKRPMTGPSDNEKPPKTFSLSKYDLESMAKYGYAFEDGEEVLITEKLEGENCSIVYAEDKLFVKSRNYWKRNGKPVYRPRTVWGKVKQSLSNFIDYFKQIGKPSSPPVAYSHWWEIPIRHDLENKLKNYPRLVLQGELIGAVKGWRYDCQIVDGKLQREFRVFDIYDTISKKYLEWSDVETITNAIGLKTVPVLYCGPWKSDRSLHDLAEGKSTIGTCVREGFVMRSIPESYHSKLGRRIIKLKGRDYKLIKS